MAAPRPSDLESSVVAVDAWLSLPTDTLVEILQRLSPPNRRWVRLVCRHWRAVIDSRAPPPPRSKPAVLACFSSLDSSSAFVIDDLATGTTTCRQVWGARGNVAVVGTCDGLLCICDNSQPGGAISLLKLNPTITAGETPPPTTVRLPPLPVPSHRHRWSGSGSWRSYSFGFHPNTGRYTVVHLPCRADPTAGFTSLQIFTLGHPSRSWRDVPVSFFPGAGGGGGETCTCDLDAGVVTVDGATYWVTMDGGRVARFDHESETVAFVAPLPVVAGAGVGGHVLRLATEARGRLGLAVSARRRRRAPPAKTEVWVLLDAGGREHRQGVWSRQYSVQVQVQEVWQRLAGPHCAHGGCVLTASADKNGRKHHVFAHRVSGADEAGRMRSGAGEVTSLRIKEQGNVVAYCSEGGYWLRTFAYVENTEPLLSVFKSRSRQ